MSEEEIYKMLLTENIEKFPLLNEIFAIRNNKFKINDYTIYVTGCISLDVINREIEKANTIDKLQKENKKLKEDNYNLDRENQLKFDKIIKENAELKEENAKLRNTNEILYETGKQNAIQELLNENWVSKNKIRAKIKELESKKEQYTEQPLIYHILKSQLEELLGDDE